MSIAFDEISRWSEVKLEIINEYAVPYMLIMKSNRFKAHYIDGFSGAGIHIRKNDGNVIDGSPLRVLSISNPFDTYYFIDLDGDKIDFLENLCIENFPDRKTIFKKGDSSEVLMRVLPEFSKRNRDRLFCLLDPYRLHLKWEVVQRMGAMGIVDLILHFPIMDINRNAIWNSPDQVPQDGIDRMNSFWGDETWRDIAYKESPQRSLFDSSPKEKQDNQVIADAFRKRLIEHGKFEYVPKPIPMRNSRNAVIYYLFFASQNKTAHKIANYLFRKHEGKA